MRPVGRGREGSWTSLGERDHMTPFQYSFTSENRATRNYLKVAVNELMQVPVPEMSAESSESILRASNTSKSVLFTWITLLTVPVLDVITAWERVQTQI